jgi:hypothetical protein
VTQAAPQIARQTLGADAVMDANLPCLDRDTKSVSGAERVNFERVLHDGFEAA